MSIPQVSLAGMLRQLYFAISVGWIRMQKSRSPFSRRSVTSSYEKTGFCGVDALKTSDYGVRRSEAMLLDINARETMGGLFLADP